MHSNIVLALFHLHLGSHFFLEHLVTYLKQCIGFEDKSSGNHEESL